jgi:hypothetical protein
VNVLENEEFGPELPTHMSNILDTASDVETDTKETPHLPSMDTDSDDEILPSNIPPGTGQFVADAAAHPAAVPQQDWDLPLVEAAQTRSGRKRRAREVIFGLCDCGHASTESKREDPSLAVKWGGNGCTTERVRLKFALTAHNSY